MDFIKYISMIDFCHLKLRHDNTCYTRGYINNDCCFIQGVNVKEELMGLVSELPAVYVKVTEMLSSVQPAIGYYKSFVEFSCSRWVWLGLHVEKSMANFIAGNQPMNCYQCCVI